jgi:bifunctional non-homologous end joining protein LigD
MPQPSGSGVVFDGATMTVGDRTLKASNLDKVLYPSARFTKRDVIEYYVGVASWLLPHLAGRPVTLKRYPDGIDHQPFFAKNCPPGKPSWVRTAKIERRMRGQSQTEYCLLEEPAALAWTANLAALELHVPLGRAETVEEPEALVFDLDPGAPAALLECCHAALEIRDLLSSWGLRCWAKTSGSKGMQLFVPVQDVSFTETRQLAHGVAVLLAQREGPISYVTEQERAQRPGRILIDWSQNDSRKTTVAVYSLRGTAAPHVSMPQPWEAIERAARRGDASSLVTGPVEARRRLEAEGDLFGAVLTDRQAVPPVAELLGGEAAPG